MLAIDYKNFDRSNTEYSKFFSLAKNAQTKILSGIGKLPEYDILSLENAQNQIESTQKLVTKIRNNYSDVIIVGMGGAILNPQLLIQLAQRPQQEVKIHYLHNTDPYYFGKLIASLDLINTAVIGISNSGNTIETISLIGALTECFKKKNIDDFDKRFYFITNPDNGNLSKIGKRLSANIIPHTAKISGRFSSITNVTTFAAAVAGVNVREFLDGARDILEEFHTKDNSILDYAAMLAASNKSMVVNLAYLQEFTTFLEWQSQIISESLGKDGKGLTPIRGLGPNDQHSMLQLYLQGPKDKFYNLYYVKDIPTEHFIDNLPELGMVSGKDLSTINAANFTATKTAIINAGLPIRTTMLSDLAPKTIGMLVMKSILEVIVLCKMFEVNPFNQPGVESIKSALVEELKD